MGKDEGCILIILIIAAIMIVVAIFLVPDDNEWQRTPNPTVVYESTH